EVPAAARPAGEHVELVSPAPGQFRLAVRPGDLVRPGGVLGELEILGRLVAVIVPEGVRGAVTTAAGDGLARPAVDFGAVLVTIDPGGAGGAAEAEAGPAAAPGVAAA